MGDQIRILRVVKTFFSFPPFLFQGEIKDCRTAILEYCRLFYLSTFVPHFAMAVFMYIYLHNRINVNSGTRRSNSPQFS